MNLSFPDLLSLKINGTLLTTAQAGLLVLGSGAQAVAKKLAQRGTLQMGNPSAEHTVWFGFSILTAPFPLLVSALMTERNMLLDKLSLFGWVDDNAILEPRAEVFGLTPFGEQPVLFLRDLDLDRPVEAWLQTTQPSRWLRIAGVVLADELYAGPLQNLDGDRGALAALRWVLPNDAQPFLLNLTHETTHDKPLRAVLRTKRKTTDSALMHVCDGWRVLAHAAKIVRVSPDAETDMPFVDAVLLDKPRNW